jgi:hypothetical protein
VGVPIRTDCVTIFLNVVAKGGTVRWNWHIIPDLCLATSWLHDLIYPPGVFETPVRCREQAENSFVNIIPHYLGRWCEEIEQESTWRTRGNFLSPLRNRISNTPVRPCFQGYHSRPFETTERVRVFSARSGTLTNSISACKPSRITMVLR